MLSRAVAALRPRPHDRVEGLGRASGGAGSHVDRRGAHATIFSTRPGTYTVRFGLPGT